MALGGTEPPTRAVAGSPVAAQAQFDALHSASVSDRRMVSDSVDSVGVHHVGPRPWLSLSAAARPARAAAVPGPLCTA